MESFTSKAKEGSLLVLVEKGTNYHPNVNDVHRCIEVTRGVRQGRCAAWYLLHNIIQYIYIFIYMFPPKHMLWYIYICIYLFIYTFGPPNREMEVWYMINIIAMCAGFHVKNNVYQLFYFAIYIDVSVDQINIWCVEGDVWTFEVNFIHCI